MNSRWCCILLYHVNFRTRKGHDIVQVELSVKKRKKKRHLYIFINDIYTYIKIRIRLYKKHNKFNDFL